MTTVKPALDIPCKRPKVTVTRDQTGDLHVAVCATGPCTWSYRNVVKSDVQSHASWHRAAHRAAVPGSWFDQVGTAYIFGCECGWQTGAGVTTRTDCEASLAAHQHSAHGLVTL